MTEGEWENCTDPQPMLAFLREASKVSDRKLRLLACGWARGAWELLTKEESRAAVDVAERYADGLASPNQLRVARKRGMRERMNPAEAGGDAAAVAAAYKSAWGAAWEGYLHLSGARVRVALRGRYETCRDAVAAFQKASEEGVATACALLREVLGNPFRPVALDFAWLTPTIVQIAQASYDTRLLPRGTLDPMRLGVLADALEEAGCVDGEILGHLRGPGPHVRGCHILDLLLGRS